MFARRPVSETATDSQVQLQYRTISASVIIGRPRDVVWAELEQPKHPAWTSPDVGGSQEHCLRCDGTLQVGNVHIHGPMTVPPFGLRQVWWTEVTQVMPGWSFTTETYAGIFDHTETLVLHDHQQGTLVRIEGHVRRVTTPEHADFTVEMLTRMTEGHLRRAAQWQFGDPPRPIDAFPERH